MGVRRSGRGRWAKAFVEGALRFMFTETDATRLWSTVMREKRHVIALAAHAPGIEIEHTDQHSLAAVTRERWGVAARQEKTPPERGCELAEGRVGVVGQLH